MRPLYLHLLDRELGDSVGVRFSPDEVEGALRVLVLGAEAPLYVGLSLAWEQPSIDPSLQSLLTLLIDHHQLDLVSHHPVLDEFLETRGSMYAHDRERYGQYFSGGQRPFEPTRFKASGTTRALESQLESELGSRKSLILPDGVKPVVETVLREREDRAITYALFAPAMPAAPVPLVGGIRRAISRLYTEHYLDFGGADLPTGIPGLHYFDVAFLHGYPANDVRLLSSVLRLVGFGQEIDARADGNVAFWVEAVAKRTADTEMAQAIRRLIGLAHAAEGGEAVPSRTLTERLRGRLTRWIRSTDMPSTSPSDRRTAASLRLTLTIERVLDAHPYLREASEVNRPSQTLVVVATDVEESMLLHVLERRYGRRPETALLARTVSRPLGQFRGGSAAYVRCRIGGHSLNGASDVVRDAIDDVGPAKVVMIGIAFGVDEDRQPIGTVLVSTQVIDYRSERAGTGDRGELLVRSRAEPGDADYYLIQAFTYLGEQRPEQTEPGPLLSDHVLVDNLEFRDTLIERHPEAVGGEMEGYGVYTASHGRHKPWVLVKAVCDWGDGNKSVEKLERQRQAATAAAERLFDYLDAR